MINNRLQRLSELLEKHEMEGIVLNAGPSLAYFTGLDFHLMERPVVFLFSLKKGPILILPRLESIKTEKAKWLTTFFYEENPQEWPKIFNEALQLLGPGPKKLGVEPAQLRFLEISLLQSAGDIVLVDGAALIASVRSLKDERELELMKKAVDIAEESLLAVLPLICLGMTEKELAAELVLQLIKHGSYSELPFAPIVAAGPNGANPHAQPSERKLREGDLLIIDWGACHEGYVSDLTRTFKVGEVDEESIRIHEIVRQANRAARARGGENVPCREVDLAAREVIENGGYGNYFTHRTGHGLGRQCHEEPYIHADNDTLLKVGMSYTIEPGIYLPGVNGVRIEDDVYMSERGTVSLSSLSRALLQVG